MELSMDIPSGNFLQLDTESNPARHYFTECNEMNLSDSVGVNCSPISSSASKNNNDGLYRELQLSPNVLEGVASAYRYKLTVENDELLRACFKFSDDLDVFSFNDVEKKRALKKEEWPVDAPVDLNNPSLYEVSVQLMAGNTEIQHCDGCAKWKEKTRKPFLVLTPSGSRCIQFVKSPFILLIFRCCPKFHSCSKQFRLVITVSSPSSRVSYYTEVNIHRKKFVSNKKRKQAEDTEEETIIPHITEKKQNVKDEDDEEEVYVEKIDKSKTTKHRQYLPAPELFPNFHYQKSQPAVQSVVAPQLVFDLLYSKPTQPKQQQQPQPQPLQQPLQPQQQQQPTPIYMQQQPTRNLLPPSSSLCDVPPVYSLGPSFWNFDAFPDGLNDEKWLESVFTELEDKTAMHRNVNHDFFSVTDLPWISPSNAPFTNDFRPFQS